VTRRLRLHRRRCFAGIAIAALAIGTAVLLYRGPGQPFVRGHVGDVAAAMLVYALIGFASRASLAIRAGATLAIATLIEIGQSIWHVDSTAGDLILGATFDPWDLVAYAVGVAVAVGVETTARAVRARRWPA
jgi:hypothetical protein